MTNFLLGYSMDVIYGGPGGDRTHDLLLKRQLLYRLSYWPKQKRRALQLYLYLLLCQFLLSYGKTLPCYPKNAIKRVFIL